MLDAWRIARELGRPIAVFWPDRVPGSYSLESLFDLEAIAHSGLCDDLVFVTADYAKVRERFIRLMPVERTWRSKLRLLFAPASSRHIEIIASVHEPAHGRATAEDEKIFAHQRELFHLLTPHPAIREALAAVLEWLPSSKFCAVHIRRGDVLRGFKRRLRRLQELRLHSQESPEDFFRRAHKEAEVDAWATLLVRRVVSAAAYRAAIRAQKKIRSILIFSDSPKTAVRFQAKLSRSRVRLMESFPTELTTTQRAFFEILVLSRATTIVSTGSNFSQVACRLGGAKFVDARLYSKPSSVERLFNKNFGLMLETMPDVAEPCRRLLHETIEHETRKLRAKHRA